MEQMTLAEVVQDIHAMDEELWHYESRYGLRTQYSNVSSIQAYSQRKVGLPPLW